ncbi:MAG: S1-like domain-containing RNA-binding protein [Saprospiraceae bacterium]|nr:S1-like domain-containing RNA-binding protein [Saprospiraceae bacterium]
MIELGKYNLLEVARDTDSGLFLEDKEGNSVLLPGKFIPEGTEVGDFLEVYIYRDNEGRLTATTQEPKITLYEFAYLEVALVGKHGAFLFYGIDKDLFVPFREQKQKMEEGRSYLVYMYLDGQTDRLTGSAKIEQFLDNADLEVLEGDEVLITVWKNTDIGTNVIVNNKYIGLIYKNELFEKLYIGDVRTAYVHKIREDGKIDVRLQKDGYTKVESSAKKILDILIRKDGFLLLTDKSSPDRIKKELGMSKKTFKKSIGSLYKKKLIEFEEKGIRLLK